MRGRRSMPVLGMVAVTILVLAACGSSAKTAKATAPSTTAGSTTTAPANGGVDVSVDAKLGSILTDAAGHTLYHFTKDANGVIACTGTCATTWPPFIAPSGGLPSDGPNGGKLATVARPDGAMQVTYNGATLYTYSGDSKPGDTNGQGIGGLWFVVAPAAAPQTATTAAPAAGAAATTARPTVTTAKPATNVTTAPTSPPATSPPATSPPTTMHPPTTCAYPPYC